MDRAENILLNPLTYSFNQIINNDNIHNVNDKNGNMHKMWAVDRTTYRGWHGIKGQTGPRKILYSYFLENVQDILNQLSNCNNQTDLNNFQIGICNDLVEKSIGNIKFITKY